MLDHGRGMLQDLLAIEDTPRGFRLVGEIDISNSEELEGRLRRSAGDGGDLVLDCSDLRFIDSTGVQALLNISQGLRPARLVLRGCGSPVRRIMDLLGVQETGLVIE